MAPTAKPAIVIIPGGFHRPSHYENVILPLREKGYTVLTPALAACGDDNLDPNTTVKDDVRSIHEELLPLLNQGKEAVIVCHSYGSVVATATNYGHTKEDRAAKGLPGGVVGLVTISGFAFLVRGKNIMGGDEETPAMPYQIVKDGLVSLTEEAKPIFYSDVSPQAADAAWSSLYKFQSRKSFTVLPQVIESDIKIPKTYILCEKDQAVPVPFQEMMIQVGGYGDVVRLESGHSPFLSMPEKVVDIIVDMCENVS